MKSKMKVGIAGAIMLAASTTQAGKKEDIRTLAELVKSKAQLQSELDSALDSIQGCHSYRVEVNRTYGRDTITLYSDYPPFGIGEEDKLFLKRTYTSKDPKPSCPKEEVMQVAFIDKGLDGVQGVGDSFYQTRCDSVRDVGLGPQVVRLETPDGTPSTEPQHLYQRLIKETLSALASKTSSEERDLP